MAVEFKLPELGENIESGDLIRVLVSVGDTVEKDQPVIELETDKATIEVPSSVAGRVKKIHVKEGAKVKVGDVILTLEDGAGGKAAAEKPVAQPAEEKREEKPKDQAETKAARQKEEKKPEAEAAAGRETEEAEKAGELEAESADETQFDAGPGALAPASPAVRRLARELGVDVTEVRGTDAGGRITKEDVKRHAKELITRLAAAPATGAARTAVPLPDFSRWGETQRQPMSNIRRKTAERLSHAWNVAPHVTQFDRADITALEEMRRQLGPRAEEKGGKLTVTAIALKVLASALRKFPQFAASVDTEREEIILKKYIHIGIAVDTDRGLLVPVIRDVDKKDLFELSAEVARVAEKARDRKLTPDDMAGGVFTVTNLGGIGGTSFSPIVNWPEVAILGLARAAWEPVWRDGAFVPRLMLPLALSYDHRLIDGADAARFLRFVAESLEKPFLLFT